MQSQNAYVMIYVLKHYITALVFSLLSLLDRFYLFQKWAISVLHSREWALKCMRWQRVEQYHVAWHGHFLTPSANPHTKHLGLNCSCIKSIVPGNAHSNRCIVSSIMLRSLSCSAYIEFQLQASSRTISTMQVRTCNCGGGVDEAIVHTLLDCWLGLRIEYMSKCIKATPATS